LCTIQEKRLRLYNESYLKIVFIYGQVAGAHTVKLVLRLINQRSLPKAGKENGIIVLFWRIVQALNLDYHRALRLCQLRCQTCLDTLLPELPTSLIVYRDESCDDQLVGWKYLSVLFNKPGWRVFWPRLQPSWYPSNFLMLLLFGGRVYNASCLQFFLLFMAVVSKGKKKGP